MLKKWLVSMMLVISLVTPIYAEKIVIDYNGETVVLDTEKNTIEMDQKVFLELSNKLKEYKYLADENSDLLELKRQYEALRKNTDEQLKLKDERIQVKDDTINILKEKSNLQDLIKKDLEEINSRNDLKILALEMKSARVKTTYTIASTIVAGVAVSSTDDNEKRAYIIGAYLLGNYIVKGSIF